MKKLNLDGTVGKVIMEWTDTVYVPFNHFIADLHAQQEENELRREDKFYTNTLYILLGLAAVIIFVLAVYNLAKVWIN